MFLVTWNESLVSLVPVVLISLMVLVVLRVVMVIVFVMVNALAKGPQRVVDRSIRH